jgi:uncharacterized protein
MFIAFIFSIILLIDFYFYQGLKTVISKLPKSTKNILKIGYWGFTLLVAIFMLGAFARPAFYWPHFLRVYFSSFIIIVTVSKFFASLSLILDDLVRLIRWPFKIINKNQNNKIPGRIKFLSQLGIVMASIPFFHMFYGMLKGAHDYRIHKNRIVLPNLPASFQGLKIVHISDVHCGSYFSTENLKYAIKKINALKADIIFFTGDLVNDLAEETDRFVEILSSLKAPMGVYSVLGNHDYADYVQWDSDKEKAENFKLMLERHKEFGWNLLLNNHKIIEKNREQLAIVGVENWGRSTRQPRYGNLKMALSGTENIPCKLLLSHDPYHWDAEVSINYPEVDATFSGHTHGMQFGVEIPGIKWSPVQYVYPHWAGAYSNGKQHLYVNRGLGYIGYAGRAGIWPEITLHELTVSEA